MKKILAAALLAASVGSPALAADMAVKARPMVAVAAAYDWSGFYVGVAGGGSWGGFDQTFYNRPGAPVFSTDYTRGNGAVFGGLQKQWGVVVVGLEAAWNTPVRNVNSGELPAFFGGGGFASSRRLDDLVTVGGRVGYAGWNNWLVYGSGGWATTRITNEYFNIAGGGPAFSPESFTKRVDGWYAGAGVDYMVYKGVLGDLIVGAEYQHVDVSRSGNMLLNQNPAFANNYSFSADAIDIVRARLSVKFNPFPAPVAVVAKY